MTVFKDGWSHYATAIRFVSTVKMYPTISEFVVDFENGRFPVVVSYDWLTMNGAWLERVLKNSLAHYFCGWIHEEWSAAGNDGAVSCGCYLPDFFVATTKVFVLIICRHQNSQKCTLATWLHPRSFDVVLLMWTSITWLWILHCEILVAALEFSPNCHSKKSLQPKTWCKHQVLKTQVFVDEVWF